MKTLFDNLTIQNKLVLSLLVLSLIPLILLTTINYQITKDILINNMSNHLQAIADRQADQIRSYLREKLLDVKVLARSPYVASELEIIFQAFKNFGLESREYEEAIAPLAKFLKYSLQEAPYNDMFLIAENGDAIFSVKKGQDLGSNFRTGIYKDTELANVFDRAINLWEPQISDLGYYPATNEPAIFIAAPILKNQGVLGAIVLQLTNEEVYRVVNNYSGLQTTGETLIISQIGNHIAYLTPTRWDPFAAFKLKVPLDSPNGEFLEKIIRGHSLDGFIKDYRDQDVLAVGKYFLPELGWGMIVKIDENELFKPLAKMKWLAIFTVLLTALIGMVIAYKMAQSIVGPILYMKNKANRIAEGNLTESINIHSKNEIGQLAHAFNEMTKKLNKLVNHLDGLVVERTKELTNAQERLVFQEKLASLGTLTAAIAHEIKNPLNFVTNFSLLSLEIIEIMKNKVFIRCDLTQDENEQLLELKENISAILDQGKKANSILQRMLDHSYLGTAKFVKINISQLIIEYLGMTYYSPLYQDFKFDLKEDFDLTIEPIDLIPEDIGRVLLNIFNNAFYAMYQKKLSDADYAPILTIQTKNLEEMVELRIRDNGIGMAQHIIKKVFNPFFTTKPPGEGTGLGLSLSYNVIVNEHKGSIEFTSTEHKYTEFIIRLPKIHFG